MQQHFSLMAGLLNARHVLNVQYPVSKGKTQNYLNANHVHLCPFTLFNFTFWNFNTMPVRPGVRGQGETVSLFFNPPFLCSEGKNKNVKHSWITVGRCAVFSSAVDSLSSVVNIRDKAVAFCF